MQTKNTAVQGGEKKGSENSTVFSGGFFLFGDRFWFFFFGFDQVNEAFVVQVRLRTDKELFLVERI